MKKRKSREESAFDFDWGLKGLKVSLGVLVVIIFFLFIFLMVNKNSLSTISEILFRSFGKLDYLAVFIGCILFIAVPFLLGVRVGLNLKKKVKANK